MLASELPPAVSINKVVNLVTYRDGRLAMQHGASEHDTKPSDEVTEMEGDRRKEDVGEAAVNGWVQRVMLGAVSIIITLLLAFFAWSVPTINTISTSTQLLAADQAYARSEVANLFRSNEATRTHLEQLTRQSGEWATRDQVSLTRDQLMEKITSVEAQLNELKLRVSLIEASSTPRQNR